MKKILKFRTKIEAVVAVSIIIMVSIGSVFAVRTITDTSDIWSGTIVIQGNTDFKSGSYFNLSKKIWNSKGHVYNASASNFQDAIDDLGNTTGWVDGNNNNITTTFTIHYGNNIEIRNVILYLDTNANVSVLSNYGEYSGSVSNVKLKNIEVNQNCLNQPAWWTVGFGYSANRHKPAVAFWSASNILVEGCNFKNAIMIGLGIRGFNNITIDKCNAYNAGANLKAHSNKSYEAFGFAISYGRNAKITNSYAYNCYSGGFYVETDVATAESLWVRDFVIDSCITEGCINGFYVECAKDGIISNCIARNGTDTTIYGFTNGFKISSNTKNIRVSSCLAENNGHYVYPISASNHCANFCIGGDNNTISDSTSLKSACHDFMTGTRTKISDCIGRDCFNISIYSYAYGVDIKDSYIFNAGSVGIYFSSASTTGKYSYSITGCTIEKTGSYGIYLSNSNTTVSDNHIRNTGSYGIVFADGPLKNVIITNNEFNKITNYGIRFYAGMDNNTVSFNTFQGTTGDAISLRNGRNNTVIGNRIYGCPTGIVETVGANWNIISLNNCKGSTITIVGADTINEHNLV